MPHTIPAATTQPATPVSVPASSTSRAARKLSSPQPSTTVCAHDSRSARDEIPADGHPRHTTKHSTCHAPMHATAAPKSAPATGPERAVTPGPGGGETSTSAK